MWQCQGSQTSIYTSCDIYSLAEIHHSFTIQKEKQADNLIPIKYLRLLLSHVILNLGDWNEKEKIILLEFSKTTSLSIIYALREHALRYQAK